MPGDHAANGLLQPLRVQLAADMNGASHRVREGRPGVELTEEPQPFLAEGGGQAQGLVVGEGHDAARMVISSCISRQFSISSGRVPRPATRPSFSTMT